MSNNHGGCGCNGSGTNVLNIPHVHTPHYGHYIPAPQLHFAKGCGCGSPTCQNAPEDIRLQAYRCSNFCLRVRCWQSCTGEKIFDDFNEFEITFSSVRKSSHQTLVLNNENTEFSVRHGELVINVSPEVSRLFLVGNYAGQLKVTTMDGSVFYGGRIMLKMVQPMDNACPTPSVVQALVGNKTISCANGVFAPQELRSLFSYNFATFVISYEVPSPHVSATIHDNKIFLTKISSGSNRIFVTATDVFGNVATVCLTASCSCNCGNGGNTITPGQIANRTIAPSASGTIQLGDYFTSALALTYSAVSNAPNCVTVSVANGTLTYNAVGTNCAATITVTASDGTTTATSSFQVTVSTQTQNCTAPTAQSGTVLGTVNVPLAAGTKLVVLNATSISGISGLPTGIIAGTPATVGLNIEIPLSGTPTATGSSTIMLTATNAQSGCTASTATLGFATSITATQVYGNVAQSQVFYKNNCGSGYVAQPYTYTVAANTYTASTQAAANLLATNDISANGQNAANTYGTCTPLSSCTNVANVTIAAVPASPAGGSNEVFQCFATGAAGAVPTFPLSAQLYRGTIGSGVAIGSPSTGIATQSFQLNVFDWNPILDAGNYYVVVTNCGGSGSATSSGVQVNGFCKLPTLQNTANVDLVAGATYNQTTNQKVIVINDATGATVSGLPNGLSYVSVASGATAIAVYLIGTVTAPNATYAVTINAQNQCSGGTATSQPLSVSAVVTGGSGGACPTPYVATLLPSVSVAQGGFYDQTFTVANATSIDPPDGLPAGLSSTITGNSVRVFGTVTDPAGTYPITVDATNACGGGLTTSSLVSGNAGSIVVTSGGGSCPAPTVSTQLPNVSVVQGAFYDQTFSVSNTTSADVVDNLPAGLTSTYDSVANTIRVFGTVTDGAGVYPADVDLTNTCGGGLTPTNTLNASVGSITVTASSTSCPVPTFAQPTPSHTYVVGDSGALQATMNPPTTGFTYQWYKDGTPLAGETNDILYFTNIQQSQAGNYFCRVTNTCGGGLTPSTADTTTANIVVNLPAGSCTLPTINSTVTPATATQGTAYTGEVSCLNATSMTSFSGLPQGLTASFDYIAMKINITGTPTVSGTFNLLATLKNNCDLNDPTRESTASGLNCGTLEVASNVPCPSPVILTTSGAGTYNWGSVVQLSVTTDNPSGYTYQWYFNGAIMGPETSSVLTMNPVTTNDSGNYVCKVTNTCGGGSAPTTVDSPVIAITVLPQAPPPCLDGISPVTLTADITVPQVGDTVTFDIQVAVGGTIGEVAWYRGATQIALHTGLSSSTDSLVITSWQSSDNGLYHAVVSDTCPTPNSVTTDDVEVALQCQWATPGTLTTGATVVETSPGTLWTVTYEMTFDTFGAPSLFIDVDSAGTWLPIAVPYAVDYSFDPSGVVTEHFRAHTEGGACLASNFQTVDLTPQGA